MIIITATYSQLYAHDFARLTTLYSQYYFRVDPRFWEISLVKPKNNRKQASLERFPKILGKPSKIVVSLERSTYQSCVQLDDSPTPTLRHLEEERRRACSFL